MNFAHHYIPHLSLSRTPLCCPSDASRQGPPISSGVRTGLSHGSPCDCFYVASPLKSLLGMDAVMDCCLYLHVVQHCTSLYRRKTTEEIVLPTVGELPRREGRGGDRTTSVSVSPTGIDRESRLAGQRTDPKSRVLEPVRVSLAIGSCCSLE